MIKQTVWAAAMAMALGGAAQAADPVKIGFIATLSTPACLLYTSDAADE